MGIRSVRTNESRCIHFATMHRAKGLEFDRVIVVAPAAYLGDPVDTEQKRKLIYVALTRAKRDALLVKVQ
jgi:superfamily I DNA/RNA helicase